MAGEAFERQRRAPELEPQQFAVGNQRQNGIADRLRRKLERQREAERAASQVAVAKATRVLPPGKPASVLNESQVTKSKKKNKKKKSKKPQEGIGQSAKDEADGQVSNSTHLLQEVVLGKTGAEQQTSEKVEDPVDEVAAMLTALKMENSEIDDAQLSDSIKTIDSVGNYMGLYASVDRQHTLTREHRERMAQYSFRLNHVVNKHHRQLPEPPYTSRVELRRVELAPSLDRMPSTKVGKEQLEWYLTVPEEVEDADTLLDLDLLYGCQVYASIDCTSSSFTSIRQ
ncbi:hypothetical protein Poli38472_013081 [Pythium oligandrum]|uniref:Uncharacterized protein n=1 Tax=Pythium oligandrum TaxID=41045 RepID=A0A8K1CJZ2_PYTOL|nr:hypothetical protein Poli38472_013081 [Pythium oligandrum]|eukprot:TMW64459.1 hypothetical protein Poli38472_013081 [Pythium oligandrum]